MCLQVLHQLRGDRAGEGLVCGVGVIARVAEHADFVFNLHHQHGVITAVDRLDVLHQRREGGGVCLLRGRSQRAQNFDRVAALDDAGKPLCILLDPGRRIA